MPSHTLCWNHHPVHRPVIDHRWHQNVVRTKSGTRGDSRVRHWCSYHILTSSVIYYWTDVRQHGIYLFYIITRQTTTDETIPVISKSFSESRPLLTFLLLTSLMYSNVIAGITISRSTFVFSQSCLLCVCWSLFTRSPKAELRRAHLNGIGRMHMKGASGFRQTVMNDPGAQQPSQMCWGFCQSHQCRKPGSQSIWSCEPLPVCC